MDTQLMTEEDAVNLTKDLVKLDTKVVEHKLSPKAAEYAMGKVFLAEQRLRFEAERLLLLSRRRDASLDSKKALRNQRRLERASRAAFEARERRRQVEAAIAAHAQADSMLGLVGQAMEQKERVDNGSGTDRCNCEGKEGICQHSHG